MPTRHAGALQHQAQEYARALAAQEAAVAQEMLATWSDAYWVIRRDLDALMAQIAAARAAGVEFSPSWLSRQQRLKTVLATTKTEMARYAAHADTLTTRAQRAALAAATKHADRLARLAVDEALPGLAVDFADFNPANLETMLGHLGDGSPVRRLMDTLGPTAADSLRDTLTRGLTLGWGQDRMVRAFTESLAVTHSRAVTIMRTESLRIYRETSRASYAANAQVIGTWVWDCALDRRSCAACVVMHGTEHPLDEILDGHPRCRCAMVPRTKSWADLGVSGVPDDRPPLASGKAWLEGQSPAVQKAILGGRKFDAWKAGDITLDDVVARRFDPEWGTMRAERSLKSIRENRNANWNGLDTQPPATPDAPTTPHAPDPAPAPPAAHPDLAHRDDTYLHTLANDPDLDPGRRAAAQAELARRAQAATQLPAGIPRSRYPDHELLRFHEHLATMDDRTLAAQLAQKDPAVRWLAERELARRAANRPAPAAYEPPWPTMDPEAWDDAMRAVNPRYTEGPEWQNNCTNCSTAWELRRRGFDVLAQSRRRGRITGDTYEAWGVPAAEWAPTSTWLQAEKAMKAMGEGARGAVSVRWKGGGGGHIFNWEVRGGRVHWIDAQPGRTHNLDDLRRATVNQVVWARLDNRPLTAALDDFLLDFSTDPT